jgi:hypothetical protein
LGELLLSTRIGGFCAIPSLLFVDSLFAAKKLPLSYRGLKISAQLEAVFSNPTFRARTNAKRRFWIFATKPTKYLQLRQWQKKILCPGGKNQLRDSPR